MRAKFQLWKRGKYFYYRLPGEKTFHSTGKTSKRQAQDFAYDRIQQGKAAETKLKNYAKDFFIWDRCEWIRRQHAKGRPFAKTMAAIRKGHLENYVFPELGDVSLADLNPVMIENWLVSLPLANQTKNHIMYTLNIVLGEAKRENLIPFNPVSDVEPMAVEHVERDVFTLQELKKLFPSDREKLLEIWKGLKWAALFNLLASAGIRSGEARALRWSSVLWDRKAILVLKAVKADGAIGETKTKAQRGIFIPNMTADLLEDWHELTPFRDPDHLVFYGPGPEIPMERGTVLAHFRPALVRAEIPIEGRNLVVHSFRHTYNTIMRKVLPLEILQEFTGHRSVKMTDHYDHPALEDRLKKLQGHKKLIEKVWE